MGLDAELIEGREAFARRSWRAAYQLLREVGPESLGPDDLDRLATAAYLVSDRDTAVLAFERSFHLHHDAGEVLPAVRDAHWIAYVYNAYGSHAIGGGWVAKAQRLLETQPEDVVERGYVLIHEMMRHIYTGGFAQAIELADHICAIAHRWGDRDLVAFGLAARGRLLFHLGRVQEGLALLDEAMASVAAREVASPIFTGEIFCSMIEGCQEISDYRRIAEWTGALTGWCDEQPDLVPYTGQCAVHRAQVLRSHGSYPEALAELALAHDRYIADGLPGATGIAAYERGEVLRVQGDYAGAEEAYAAAAAQGHSAQPGLALLWLARGRTAAAVASIRRLLDEARDPVTRSQVLPAAVEVYLAGDEVEAAAASSSELVVTAGEFGCEAVTASAAYAAGLVALAGGDAAGALASFRRAWKGWIDLGARHEAAWARVRIALAYRALRDEDSALSELAVAGRAFAEIGAGPARSEVERLMQRTLPDGLTAREVEVLRLVASGQSNPQIATALFLSQKTVQRHLSNIFTKTGVTSRTAAAAYAYEHRLT
jgi:DNA-binding NarL/FixJ family response regulator